MRWDVNGDSGGEGGRIEAWRQRPKAEVGKSEEKHGDVETNGKVNETVRH